MTTATVVWAVLGLAFGVLVGVIIRTVRGK